MQDRADAPRRADDLTDRVAAAWPATKWRDVNVAVAVSGGADSVALLRALADLKSTGGGRGDLAVVHFDHGLRGEESAADARWVGELAAGLGLRFENATAESSHHSEEQLRNARRAFYESVTNRLGARYVATGHTADDQAETVMFRVLRGTGVRGLAGIAFQAPLNASCTLVRPLLDLRRRDVAAYLSDLGQTHREDSTNAESEYARNWIRNEAIPLLESRLPGVCDHLASLASHAAEVAATLEGMASALLTEALVEQPQPTLVRLRVTDLAGHPQVLIAEVLRQAWRGAGWPEQAMTAAHWRQLAAHVGERRPAEHFPGGVRVDRFGETLVLACRSC